MAAAADEVKIHRGLKGVYFERSPTTFIDGRAEFGDRPPRHAR